MKPEPGHLLVIEDDQAFRELLEESLARKGHRVDGVASVVQADTCLANTDYDLVLTDLNMPGESGTQFCARLQQSLPDLPVLVMTAFGSMETAIAALRAGAYDFITKPVDLDLLALTLERALQHRRLTRQLHLLQNQVRQQDEHQEIWGSSPVIQHLREQIARLAPFESSVLLSGASGTGKELAARALHRLSRRRGEFVAINCAALPENLLESELFGHEKGAFTDARTARTGLFIQADGGTLLLDEIAELPLSLQPKLLRVLEERRVRPLGSRREIACDVRILAASHRRLQDAVEDGSFREDLYYRLNVIELPLPPLAARGNDILLLATRFIAELAPAFKKQIDGLSEPAAARLLAWHWPGNVRELRNVIERALALCRHNRITVEDLPPQLGGALPAALAVAEGQLLPLAEIERLYIQQVLHQVDGNRTLAARILGVDRKTLYRKLTPESGA